MEIIDVQSGQNIACNVNHVVISANEAWVTASITLVTCPVDVLAQVKDVKLNGDVYEIPVNKTTHSVEMVHETEDFVMIRVIKK
jgi:hypothetical protein